MEGVCTSHLQNIGLWETMDQSTSEIPREPCRQMCAGECEHTERHTVHEEAPGRTQPRSDTATHAACGER